MSKEYTIAYKTYFNERLKKSLFHTKLMYPLYVQVTFDRTPITFKSYYYDLFSKPKYAIRIAGEVFSPDINEVREKEERFVEFIIDKNIQNFSLDTFKKEYAFYSRDLLDMMEDKFLDYLFTFLHDEGLPYLADTIKKGASDCKLYSLVEDMRSALAPSLYNKLIENSFDYAAPYLPLCKFTEKPKRTPLTSFTVMEWEKLGTKEAFIEFFKKHYPDQDADNVLTEIQQWINQ